jgi:F-type H+-transporting ATPase subunit epsilon
MYLEIVTPEAVVFRAKVDAVKVPGNDGEFQMLNSHAPIVSVLTEGDVKIDLAAGSTNEIKAKDQSAFRTEGNNTEVLFYTIKGGVLEMKDNKAIILAD